MRVEVAQHCAKIAQCRDLVVGGEGAVAQVDLVRLVAEPAVGLAHRQHLDPLASGSDRAHAGERAGEQQRGIPVVGADDLTALLWRGLFVAEAFPVGPGSGQLVISGRPDIRTND